MERIARIKIGLIKWLFVLNIFLLFIRYIVMHWGDFGNLRVVSPGYIIIMILLSFVFSLTYGIIIKYLLEACKINLSFSEWFGLSILTGFYNIIAPVTGGLVSRAAYLKKKHNFSITEFVAVLSGIYVTHLFVGGLLGIISMLLIYYFYGLFNWVIFL